MIGQKVRTNRYSRESITIVDKVSDLDEPALKQPDLVVLGMKLVLLDPELGYDDSPKVWLSDYLAERGIGFTGSETYPLQVEFDKPIAKQNVIDAGLESPAYFISTIKAPTFRHDLSYPLSSHSDCDSDVLVEEYLTAREFSVAVVANHVTGKLIAMPIEIISPLDRLARAITSTQVGLTGSGHIRLPA